MRTIRLSMLVPFLLVPITAHAVETGPQTAAPGAIEEPAPYGDRRNLSWAEVADLRGPGPWSTPSTGLAATAGVDTGAGRRAHNDRNRIVAGTSDFTPETLLGSTIWTTRSNPVWATGYGAVLDFEPHGSGVSFEETFQYGFGTFEGDPATLPEPFTWFITGGVLDIAFGDYSTIVLRSMSPPYQELVDTYGFDQAVADFMTDAFNSGAYTDVQVEIVRRNLTRTVVAAPGLPGKADVSVEDAFEYSMDEVLTSLAWPDPLPSAPGVENYESFFYPASMISNALAEPPAAGDTWAVPLVYSPLEARLTEPAPEGFYIDIFTLDALGGTSSGLMSQEGYAWSATAEGLVFEAGGETYTYTPLETDGSVWFALATYAVSGEVTLRSAQWIARGDGTGDTLAADLLQPIPLYWQAGLNLPWAGNYDENGQLLPILVFGYSFAGDGSSFRIFGGGEDCLSDEFDPCFFAEGEPLWTWTSDAESIVRDRMQSEDFLRTRAWTVLRYAPGGRAVVLEWALWEPQPDPWYFVIPPRLNTLEVFNLAAWPEEWADAEGFVPAPDGDGDFVPDSADNCTQRENFDQRDDDGDGIGTACDPDHNQDCNINFVDLGMFYAEFLGDNQDYDYTGDGYVNFADFGRIKSLFFGAPGPSAAPNLCDSD